MTDENGKVKAIDAWASHISPEGAQKWPDEFNHIFRRYKSGERIEKGITIEKMLEDMDEANMEISVLSAFHYQGVEIVTNEDVAETVEKYPDRFVGSGTVDPRGKPMDVVREVERLVNDLGMRAVRLEPYAYGGRIHGAASQRQALLAGLRKMCGAGCAGLHTGGSHRASPPE